MELVAVVKDGVRIDVHPSALTAHRRLGWSVVEPVKPETAAVPDDILDTVALPAPPVPKRRGRPPLKHAQR